MADVSFDFRGRGAVVTGAAMGIGAAVAQRLTAAGAKVSLWDIDASGVSAAAEACGAPSAIAVDVTDDDAVAKAADRALSEIGTIHAVVTAVGLPGPRQGLLALPPDQWRWLVDVNLHGTYLVLRTLVPAMVRHGFGRVVTVASTAAKEGSPLAPAYSAAKAGVVALTKSLGRELAAKGVAVNCVTHGAIDTPMLEGLSSDRLDAMAARVPMGRLGQPEEVADMILWLLSGHCEYTTGQVFDISGGRATY